MKPTAARPFRSFRAAALPALGLALLAMIAWLAVAAPARALPAGEGPNGAIELDQAAARGGAAMGNAGHATDVGPGAFLLRALGALAFVLALLVLAAYLFRRYGSRLTGAGQSARADAIHIVATKLLGGRRSLMLVRVRGQTLLLGVTPQSINCLTEIQELEGEWAQPAESEGAGTTPFQRHLGRTVSEVVGKQKDENV